MSDDAKFLVRASATLWALAGMAGLFSMLADPAAINAALGLGVGGTCSAIAAAVVHRWDRSETASVKAKPDYRKIAALERELGLSVEQPRGVLRRIERDGETIELRSWNA
ncbi:hypothetical protein [Streptomyces globisporus]